MTRSRRVLAGTIAAAALVALTACIPLPPTVTPTTPATPSTPTQTGTGLPFTDYVPTGEDVDADLEPFYAQDVDWQPCMGNKNVCGMVTVPLDWGNAATSETIQIRVVISPARGERQGVILYNPGGPGGSGADYVASYSNYLMPDAVLEHYDLVGFDPRGVNGSTAISCYDDPQTMYDYLYDIGPESDAEYMSDAWIDEALAASEPFVEDCEEFSGELLEFVGTIHAVKDMDVLRALLGEEQLNYLGVSYGTLLGSTYADQFPENVGRFVLDAAVAPTATDFEGTLFQAGGFELAFDNFLEDCLTQPDCALTGDLASARQQMTTLFDSLDDSPLPAADGRELGSSSFFTAIAANLYSQSSWPTLRALIADTLAGDPESAFASADSYYGVNPDGTFADNSTEALIAINCMDYTPVTDYNQLREEWAQVQEAAPLLSRFFIGPTSCINWPYPADRTSDEITAPGANPIVVIGGLNDPATPYQWSVDLAEQLESGVLITVDAEGHSQFNSGDPCVDDPVIEYFLTGTAPTADITCP